MLSRLPMAFCYLLYLLVLAPHIYSNLRPSTTDRLGGVESAAPPPSVSLDTFWDGKLATDVDSWFSRNMGFREELIRTDNQLNFTVFREISAQTSSPIVLGRHNTLFEKSYIDALNNRNRVSDIQLAEISRDLAELQHLLRKRNITLMLLISPNKAVSQQSEVPSRLLRKDRAAASRNIETLRAYLRADGVTVLDTPDLFSQPQRFNYPLFAKGGTHWSYFGACVVTEKMMQLLEATSGQPLRQVDCSNITLSAAPRLTDKDLAELANLWTIKPFYQELAYPAAIASNRAQEKKPRIVFVGSSYLWTILHYLKKFRVTEDYKMLYYYRTMHRQRGPKRPISRETLDWEALLQRTDVVVIEANEAAIEGVGYGFIQDAIHFLRSR